MTEGIGTRYKDMANALRALSMDAVQKANSGHPGMPMGMADVATVLWSRHMKFDPAAPNWADRDRFVLSAGHGSMLIYSLLHLTGFEDVTLDQIKNFRQLGSNTAGHPEYGHTPGVEATTGPLGQGISMAVGMALAERMLNAEFGDDLVDHRTWVVASDGDLQEGISHEAISLAGHLKLNRLCVLWDDNEISIDGPTQMSESTDVCKRFEAAGWTTAKVDGHDMYAIDKAIEAARSSDKPDLASRAASGKTLEAVLPAVPGLAGGSADLTGSNLTKTSHGGVVSADDYAGPYIHFGVREHGMAACANGMALHGGLRPYVATFLVFADYCRGSMRLSSLMEQPVVYVLTHDSIGLGEDGPTHQPVETLASLRAIPNMYVFRPADALETAEAWELSLQRQDGPSVLALSRQKLPFLREDDGSENLSARGAYVLRDAADAKAVIIATGSEVSLAVEAAQTLAAKGIAARVVSAPCLDLFAEQDKAYRDMVLPEGVPVVAVEAALRYGWDSIIGRDGGFVGMTGFGASAPAGELYKHFGITAEAVVSEVEALLG
jgi:transketolase